MNYIINYPFSAFMYIAIIIIIPFLSFYATRVNKKETQIAILSIIILLLSLFSGFRGPDVGNDTSQYLTHIQRWQLNIEGAFSFEPGLFYLTKLSLLIINDPQFVFVIVAFIINLLITIRLWTFKKNVSFTFAMFLYTSLYYVMTFSGIRQWLAIAIVFFSSKFLFERRYFKYVIIVIIAGLFHNTALLALTFLFLDSVSDKLKYRKQKNIFILFLLGSPILLIGLMFVDNLLNVSSRYSKYLLDIEWSEGIGILIWLKLLLALCIYIAFSKKDFQNADLFNKVMYIYIPGLIISIPGYYIANLARIGFYLTFFEIVIFAMIVKTKNKKKAIVFLFIIFLYSMFIFIVELAGSGRGHVPYIPFWQYR